MNIHDVVVDFINDPSEANFYGVVAALVEYRREYYRIPSPENKVKNKKTTEAKSDNLRSQVQIEIARNMKSFPTEEKRKQFEIIVNHLFELGIEITLYRDTAIITAWKLKWGKDTAMLLMGSDWEICPIRNGQPLKGQFEGFDLLENLDANGIDVSDW